jgi:hypothetical protein
VLNIGTNRSLDYGNTTRDLSQGFFFAASLCGSIHPGFPSGREADASARRQMKEGQNRSVARVANILSPRMRIGFRAHHL